MAYLTSTTQPLHSSGAYGIERPDDSVWRDAEQMGLRRAEYGKTWFVYESEQDYLQSLD